ncbi:MAG: EamA family transporter [Rubricoccaceae bacterium]|nr:EamA family transporter [Rubricoccaceae bacterium]
MVWLLLSVVCNLAIAMIFKISEKKDLDRTALLTVNYAVAGLIAGVLIAVEGARQSVHVSTGLVVLGMSTGALFIAGFYVFSYAIRETGMGLATGVMRIAVVLPVLASWLIWNEQPLDRQLVGLGIACVAFFLIGKQTNGKPRTTTLGVKPSGRSLAVLALLFLAGGLVDVAMKAFSELFSPANSEALFLVFVFWVAFTIGFVVVLGRWVRTRESLQSGILGLGVGLGIANYGSAAFILKAITELPGPFVFPANSIAIVAGAALLGAFFWKERYSGWNILGLTCAVVSLVLLWR